MTVLVADDNLLIRKAYADIFADEGYEVVAFDNGRDALNACSEAMPDIIILDIHMPVLDGVETCRGIRELPTGKDVPIVIISGSMGKSEAETIDCGASRFVHKPVDTDELVGMVAEMLLSR